MFNFPKISDSTNKLRSAAERISAAPEGGRQMGTPVLRGDRILLKTFGSDDEKPGFGPFDSGSLMGHWQRRDLPKVEKDNKLFVWRMEHRGNPGKQFNITAFAATSRGVNITTTVAAKWLGQDAAFTYQDGNPFALLGKPSPDGVGVGDTFHVVQGDGNWMLDIIKKNNDGSFELDTGIQNCDSTFVRFTIRISEEDNGDVKVTVDELPGNRCSKIRSELAIALSAVLTEHRNQLATHADAYQKMADEIAKKKEVK